MVTTLDRVKFRYLLDMINIVLRVGWFHAAASGAGLRGRGRRLAHSQAAQRRGRDADTGRRILLVAGPPVGVANAPCSLARSCG